MNEKTLPITRKRFPRWLIWLLVLGALLIAVAWILPRFLDVDRYRTLVRSAIEERTGRHVTIGKISARLLPRLSIVVDDFHLGNPPGFAPGEVLSIDSVHGNLALGPLVRKDIQISSLELVHPKITLLEDERGQTNYQAPASRPGTHSHAHSAPGVNSSLGGRFKLSTVDRIELSDAEFTLGQIASPSSSMVPSLHAGKIRITLTHVALDPFQPKQWAGASDLSGVHLTLAGWKDPLEFRSGSLKLHEGQMESDLRLVMGKELDAKGNLQVADVEHPAPVFDLKADKLDLDALLAAQTPQPAPPPPRPHRGNSELLAHGRIAANSVHSTPFVGTNALAELRIFGDRLEVWPLTVELYGGIVQVSLRADRTEAPERFSANIQVRNLDAGKLLSVASPSLRGKFAGTGELNLQLFGSLGSAWRKPLTGSGHFAVRDGHLPGVEPRGALGAMATLVGAGASTPFSLIEGDLTIGQGRVTSQRIHMTSPRGTIDMKGSLGLDGSLNYDGQAVLMAGASGAAGATDPLGALLGSVLKSNITRATVPFALRGTIGDPKFLPGRGLPQFETAPSAAPKQPGQQPQQPKKSILDLFRPPSL